MSIIYTSKTENSNTFITENLWDHSHGPLIRGP